MSASVVCCIYLLKLLTNINIEATGVDPDQTAHTGAVLSGCTLFDQEASETFQQTTKAVQTFVVIGALRINCIDNLKTN